MTIPVNDEMDQSRLTSEENTLYPGDTGVLNENARRVLVQLLMGPSIDASRHSKLWPALILHQEIVRSRLAELFLELVVDMDLQVAFTRQADTCDLDAPIILRRKSLTFLDSVLMLYLRQLLTEADTQVQRAVVSSDEIHEQMKLYENSQNTDKVMFSKRISSTIKKAQDSNLLSAIRGSESRFEISSTLKLLFTAEEISALTGIYERYQDKSSGEISE